MEAPRLKPIHELLGMAWGAASMPRLLTSWRELPRGDGGVVVVVPGFMTGDTTTLGLRLALRALGYRPQGWGLGLNHGNIGKLLPQVVKRVERAVERGGSVRLVGWSLGGVVAREVARQRPGWVSAVVTLGSPVVGGPKYTATAHRAAARGVDLDAAEARVAERNATPIDVPITAIYSRRDTMVSWEACLDPHPENRVEHVEVAATHFEMGFTPEVFRHVARALAHAKA